MFLTREPGLYSLRRFGEAAAQQGHEFRTIDPLAASLTLHARGAHVWVGGNQVHARDLDVLVPRVGTSVTEQGCAVVSQFEAMGVPVVNGAEAILRARDKLRSLQVLGHAGVPVPATVVVRSSADLDDAIIQVGGLPCVLKLLKGTQGIGVMLAESRESLESILQAFWSLGHTVLLQQFIQESKGKDVRALVVGGRVVAAMRRAARVGEFRSNIHRGGSGHAVRLSATDHETAVRAAHCLGLDVAGVDFLESDEGARVIEVNSSPGFQGLEAATQVDVAAAIVAHAARRAVRGAP